MLNSNYQMGYFTVLENLNQGQPTGILTIISFSEASDFFSWYAQNQDFHQVHYKGDSQEEAGRVWEELNPARIKSKTPASETQTEQQSILAAHNLEDML